MFEFFLSFNSYGRLDFIYQQFVDYDCDEFHTTTKYVYEDALQNC